MVFVCEYDKMNIKENVICVWECNCSDRSVIVWKRSVIVWSTVID